jgi:serine/threonine-protein kinase
MTPERWTSVQALFERAAALPAAEQHAFVRGETAGDDELCELVCAMLDADAGGTESVQAIVADAIRDLTVEPPVPGEQRLGPYRLVSEIGRGGMGTVYLAERDDGAFDQRVAVKVVRGLLDRDRIRRFRAERQILATLDHPNIARLLDGGTTADGLPYLVMEHVEGTPIDVYCRERQLDVPERLRLFATVCDAVIHAHRHLIIHRDIKPTNILVTTDGTPKLLDFGIAKLLDTDDPDLAMDTMTGMRVLTPDYAAPEQVRGQPVTTATDVYALGVLLFELLTERRPHTFRALTAQEIERVVCDTDAPRPSTVRQSIDEDLDVIVGTALQKDQARRYLSVEAFVDDVRRMLDGLPIHARASTWRYRTRRFVSRNRWGVAAAATFVLMLVGFAVIVSLQAARIARERDFAQQERDAAEQVASFMVDMFEVADPGESRGATVTARELLDRGAERVETGLADQPGVQGRMMTTMGRAYRGLGLFAQSQDLLERALDRREQVESHYSDAVAETLGELGDIVGARGNYEEAERHHREALAIRQALHGTSHDTVAFALNDLGTTLQRLARYDEAEEALAQAIAIWREVRPAGDPQIASGLNNLGLLLRRVNRYGEAEPVLQEALDIRRRAFREPHPEIANSLMQMGQLKNELGQLDEAEALMRESLAMRLQMLGPDHPDVGTSYNNLASLLHDRRDYDRAEEMYRASIAINRKRLGEEHPESAVTLNNLASLLEDRGDLDQAEAIFREALAIRRKALGEEHPAVARGLNNLAIVLIKQNKIAEAQVLAERSLAVKRKALGDEHVETAQGLVVLARVKQATGHVEQALPLTSEALATIRRILPADHPLLASTLIVHSRFLVEAGRQADAVPLIEEALAIRIKRMQPGDEQIAQAEALLTEARR